MARNNRILITGAGGLLGSEFAQFEEEFGVRIFSSGRDKLDITDPAQVEAVFRKVEPQVVINCAAYTNVDGAESEQERSWKVNVEGVKLLARYCRKTGAKLVHYSTDSIFNGEKPSPYLESDSPAPLSFYGKTKLESERVVQAELSAKSYLLLRINWPYGRNGNNFINNVLKNLKALSERNTELKVADDQIGSPTPAKLLAHSTLRLIQEGVEAVFHLSCSGACSKFEFLSFLGEQTGRNLRLHAGKMSDFPAAAKRPKNSVLGTERRDVVEIAKMPSWQDALRNYLEDEKCC